MHLSGATEKQSELNSTIRELEQTSSRLKNIKNNLDLIAKVKLVAKMVFVTFTIAAVTMRSPIAGAVCLLSAVLHRILSCMHHKQSSQFQKMLKIQQGKISASEINLLELKGVKKEGDIIFEEKLDEIFKQYRSRCDEAVEIFKREAHRVCISNSSEGETCAKLTVSADKIIEELSEPLHRFPSGCKDGKRFVEAFLIAKEEILKLKESLV